MRLKNKNILIYGFSITGQAVFNFLKNKKCNIFIFENFCSDKIKLNMEKYKNDFIKYGVTLFDLNHNNLKSIDLIIVSPGVPLNSELLKVARKNKILIMGEIEFAYRFCKSKNIIGITGTNGKTTTASLVHHIVKTYKKCYIGGNIGIPFISFADKVEKDDVVVLELSSFQLETTIKFKPKISCVLNLHPDHLDRYGNEQEYYKAKLNIIKKQTYKNFCVINYDDANFSNLNLKKCIKKYYFSLKNNSANAFCFNDEFFIKNIDKGNENIPKQIAKFEDVNLIGSHNYLNILASILICKKIGVPNDFITSALKTFKPLNHRLEFVKNINGVCYYNDSKATNIDACLSALETFKDVEVRLLLGGSDKGEDFSLLFKKLGKNVQCYLYGEVLNKMVQSAENVGYYNYKTHKMLIDALTSASCDANAGDVVLLSPACASFDEFSGYEERGDFFKSWVNGGVVK